MKTPWIKPIIVGLVLLLIIGGIHYVSKRLPPSKVNLVFQGWRNAGTNIYADFELTNMGPRSIYWGLDRTLIRETELGWVTNRFEQDNTILVLGTPPGSKETFSIRF